EDNCEAILSNAFRADSVVYNVILGENIKSIFDYAFYSASSLKNVTFNDKLEYIGEYGFYDCPLNDKFFLSDNITHIGSYTFYSNENLEEIRLPKALESLENNVINNSANLKSILIYNNINNIVKTSFTVNTDTKLYYYGTKEEFDNISITGYVTTIFDDTNRIYYFSENIPLTEGNFFHLFDKKIVEW
ncbi:MAG: leucine-rich repeat domain-containing protein, partial [Acholeplasmatales bacterium]|nr:leucine-rich repeat domain-containing protein [Acholeplasmatales bacterium]